MADHMDKGLRRLLRENATVISLERRTGDCITNSHMHELAQDGFRIIGACESKAGFVITFSREPLNV